MLKLKIQRNLPQILKKRMPSSICCTNCRTKYSLLNREAGCSKCALSFCKKCLGYRAVIPTLSDQPMIVCYNCYQKLEAAKIKQEVIITSTPLPNAPRPGGQNWWGEGLPPPSFRQGYASTSQPPRIAQPPVPQPQHHDLKDLEQRRAQLRPVPAAQEPLSVEEIEERLARLRGCDVEQIRNPRSWFHTSEPVELHSNSNNPADLIRQAQDRARIEEKEEKAEQKDWDELEDRRRRIFEKEEDQKDEKLEQEEGGVRESVVSGASEFSEATKQEMSEINNMLQDAEKRVAETKKQEDHDAAELRTLMRNTRQKSLDAMQWNEKITKEIGGFWDRRNEKEGMEEEDDEKSLDEETFKKILYEAENTPDLPDPTSQKSSTLPSTSSENSPKKKGFFGKFFSRESRK